MVEACIMCHEFKAGAKVEDTLMLRSLRRLKADFPPIQILWGKPTGNTLVVCPDCMEKFKKKRKSYEGKLLLHMLLAVGLMIFIVVLPLVAFVGGGPLPFGSLLVGLLLTILLMSLPLLDYVPPLDKGETEQKEEQKLHEQAPKEQAKESTPAHEDAPLAGIIASAAKTKAGKTKTKTTAPRHEKKKTASGRRR